MTSFVADKFNGVGKSALRKIFESAPAEAINFGIGEIQFPTPKLFLKEAERILREENLRYTPNAGLLSTREAIASYYQQVIDAKNVCITVGAEEAVYATLKAIINPGDQILISDPAFLAYQTIIGFLGGETVKFDLLPKQEFAIDFDDLLSNITTKTKALILTNPSNPMGKILSKEELEMLISICRKNEILIICDEVYKELYVNKPSSSMLNLYEHSVVISSLSKSHCMSGWRLGWAVSRNSELVQAITVAHQYIATCAAYLAQRVAVLALSPSGLAEVNKLRLQLNMNRKYLLGKLSETSTEFLLNDASPYLFIKTRVDDYELSFNFINKGLIVIPGSIFGKNGQGWIRVNYGIARPVLEDGIKILCEELN